MSIRNLKIEEVQFRGVVVGYRVGGIHRMCSDSLWDPIAHRAIFRSRERAERFLARVSKVMPWNLKMTEWIVGASWNGAYSVL
jgi:hypothetical protein